MIGRWANAPGENCPVFEMDVLESTTCDEVASPAPPGEAARAPGVIWLPRVRGRWTWTVRADWAELLDAQDAPDFSNLEADGRAILVKTNDGRCVWRVEWGRLPLFVKVSRPGRQWAWLRRFVFGADAAREKSVADYAALHGVDTVAPVAVATAPFHGRDAVSILITLGAPHALPLNEYWAELDPRVPAMHRARNEVIDATARLIARAHAHGCEHTDLHAGNVLIESNGQTTCRALFVDLLSIRTGRPVAEAGVVRNLAQLNQWFRTHATLADRVRFLRRYLEWRAVLDPQTTVGAPPASTCRRMLPQLEQAVIQHADTLYAKRDRRTLRTGRYFAHLHLAGGWQAHVFLESKHAVEGSTASVTRFTREQWQAWLKHPEEWTQATQRQYTIKDSPSSFVYRRRLESESAQSAEVICKRSLARNPLKRATTWLFGSRPMRTWRLANALLNRQIPTARPLAVVERHWLGRPVDAFLLTECIENAYDLDALLTVRLRELSACDSRRLKQQVIAALVPVLRRLHERGFAHRDLKAPNVMVQWAGDLQQPPRVLLVDLDGLRQVRRPNPAAEIRALGRLSASLEHCRRVTRTDRLRFLIRYLARPACPEPQWREQWNAIAAAARRKLPSA